MRLYAKRELVKDPDPNWWDLISDEVANWMNEKTDGDWDYSYISALKMFEFDVPDTFEHVLEFKLRYG